MRRGLVSLAIFFAFVAIYTLSRHTTTTTTTTTTAASASTTTTTVTGSTAACTGSDFSGAYNTGEGAAGTIYATVTLTKTSPGSCAADGYPTLTLLDRLGAVLTSRTVDVPGQSTAVTFLDSRAKPAPTRHVVASGATLTFSLAYSDVPTGSQTTCPSAQTVSVGFAAGESSAPVTPAVAPAPCDGGLVWVSPLY
ncbi:MAG: DUF4232 domain-containing protein [Acidimicrobiales bacterium]